MRDWFRDWNDFFFAPRELWSVALFRIVTCGSLFLLYLGRQDKILEYYTSEGLFSRDMLGDLILGSYEPSFYWFMWPDSWMPMMHGLLLFLLALLTLGVGGRKIAWVTFIIQAAFNQRNPVLLYSADVIGSLWLFYLCFCRSNAHLNFWDWARRVVTNRNKTFSKERKSEESGGSDPMTSMGVRLIQIHLCLIYVYSAMGRLSETSWWDGNALWTVIGNPLLHSVDAQFLLGAPVLLGFVSFFMLIFEFLFPAGIWLHRLRPWWMVAGFLSHVIAAVVTGFYVHYLLLIGAYLFFVSGLLTHNRGSDGFSHSYSVAGR